MVTRVRDTHLGASSWTVAGSFEAIVGLSAPKGAGLQDHGDSFDLNTRDVQQDTSGMCKNDIPVRLFWRGRKVKGT